MLTLNLLDRNKLLIVISVMVVAMVVILLLLTNILLELEVKILKLATHTRLLTKLATSLLLMLKLKLLHGNTLVETANLIC